MRFSIFAFCCYLFLSGCTSKTDLCEATDCDAPMAQLRVKYLDEDGNNLLNNYSQNSIVITSSLGHNVISMIDSTDQNNPILLLFAGSDQTYSVKMPGYAPDKIYVRTIKSKAVCCASIQVHEIRLNSQLICGSCKGGQMLIIKK